MCDGRDDVCEVSKRPSPSTCIVTGAEIIKNVMRIFAVFFFSEDTISAKTAVTILDSCTHISAAESAIKAPQGAIDTFDRRSLGCRKYLYVTLAKSNRS